MADNVEITPGTGEIVHADEYTHAVFGAGKSQLVKVTWGPAGTGNDVDTASGKPLPIQLRTSTGVAASFGSGAIDTGTARIALATDSPGVATLGQTTMSASQPVVVASDQVVPVSVPGDLITVTLTTDTSAYIAGDVLAATQVITNAVRVVGGVGMLESINVIDSDDQGLAFDIYILNANNSMGTENAAPSISDGDAAAILGRVSIVAGDYTDLGGVREATRTGIGLPVKATGATRDLYIAAITRGTPTYASGAIPVKLGFSWA